MNEEKENQQQLDQSGEGQEQQNQEHGSQVTFTDEQQAAIDGLIAKQVAKERQRAETQAEKQRQEAEKAKQDAVKTAEERAKMSAEERAKAEQEDREKEFAKKQQELDHQLREVATKNMLIDKGMSTDMLPLVMGADDDETSQRLDLLNKYVEGEVQKATEKLMSGKKNPTTGNGGSGIAITDNPWAEGSFNLTKQQQILSTDPVKAQQMIAQAQPKQGFYFGKN